MYRSVKAAQRDWESAPIIRVSSLDRNQIIIRALFDVLEPFVAKLAVVQILTATNASEAALLSYKAFQTQYAKCEMRTDGNLHDRWVLWDHSQGFHSGHSFKDLGAKESQLNVLDDPIQHWRDFDARWAKAGIIS
jgi:hypothetical protein